MVKFEEIGSERRSSGPSHHPSSSSASPPSPPRPSRAAEKVVKKSNKSICFSGHNYKQKETKWYVFEVSDDDDGLTNNDFNEILKSCRLPDGIALVPRHFHIGENKFGKGVLTPISSVAEVTTHERGSCVAMGSVIYRFESVWNHDNRVLCFDLQCPESGWRNLPPMINPRCQANAVALDGKLYALGGGLVETQQQPRPWGEVYDPCLKIWVPLPPPPWQSPHVPPPECPPQLGATVDASEKKILVEFYSYEPPYARNVIYLYDARTNSWGVIDGAVQLHCGTGAAVVDRTVYWLSCGRLKAFELKRKVWSQCFIDGLEEEYVMRENGWDGGPILLHLDGDKFCIFWVANAASQEDKILSHCVKIRVSKSDHILEGERGQFKLNAFVESCQSYTLDQKIDYFNAHLIIDGSQLRKEVNGGGEVEEDKIST